MKIFTILINSLPPRSWPGEIKDHNKEQYKRKHFSWQVNGICAAGGLKKKIFTLVTSIKLKRINLKGNQLRW